MSLEGPPLKTELKLQQTRDAIAELETVLRFSTGNSRAQHLLSQAYRRLGDSQPAAKYADTDLAEPAASEGDLLGDFLLPEWEIPAEVTAPEDHLRRFEQKK